MANMIQYAKDQVSGVIARAYAAAAQAGALPGGVAVKGSVEIPKDPKNGDYAASFAMAGAKALQMAPRAIAQALADHMDLHRHPLRLGGDRRAGLSQLPPGPPVVRPGPGGRSRPKAPSTARARRGRGRR